MNETETLNFVSMVKTLVKKAERCTNEDAKNAYEDSIDQLEGFLFFFAHNPAEIDNAGLWRGHNDYHLTVSHLMAKLEERIVQLETNFNALLPDVYKEEIIRLGQEITKLKDSLEKDK